MANKGRDFALEGIRSVFHEALKPCPEIDERSSMDNVPGWDSVSHLAVVVGFEKRFGLKLTLSELRQLTSVRAMRDLLKAKGL